MGATRREWAAAKRAHDIYEKLWHKNYASAVNAWFRLGPKRWFNFTREA